MTQQNWLWVGIGGGLGALARDALSLLGQYHRFPLNFFVINVSGSFLIGIVMALSAELGILEDHWRLFWGVGFLGGFTTFSTFMLGAHRLWSVTPALSLAYLLATLFLGLMGAYLGLISTRQWVNMRLSRHEPEEMEQED
ncbi:MAG: CrcB family protein [Firmicutes bacterium]|jgi:CrcB protein|uniref:Fluoride-specific ion channel FluC n=1 Tax=Sulfobacillus benefaciens TaxID=453960 RepID=A0A2T2WYC9_9FIRM|nr:CrcB family protein [Bacillota bacterium]MCL5015245.1 CrcB family protein [Bacillota bacterium]PSR27232.1 MAG: CrcB family protein [Sulfobacillus benefaciens]HBQ96642.1 CrcB family protein [Sulfobacillus sp.]